MPIDWSRCPAVRVRPGYLSGGPAPRDDPRVPPETVVEKLDSGETAEQNSPGPRRVFWLAIRWTSPFSGAGVN
jgi:hypothetical protein